MSDSELFAGYVEALNALNTVESRRRDALRKAVERAAASEDAAKRQMADQQRMYDRAGKDVHDVHTQLQELHTLLGVPQASTAVPTPQAGSPPQLMQLRGAIRDIGQWATDSKSLVESLLRSRDRLARPAIATTPALPKPTSVPVVPDPPTKVPVGLIAAIAAGVLILIVVIAVFAL